MTARVLCLFCLLAAQACASETVWYSDVDAAVAKGKQDNKRVLVVFSMDRCPYCDKLDVELAKPAAAEAIGKYVACKVNTSNDRATGRKFSIRVCPSLRVIDPAKKAATLSGQVVSSRDGYMEAQQLAAWLERPFTPRRSSLLAQIDVLQLVNDERARWVPWVLLAALIFLPQFREWFFGFADRLMARGSKLAPAAVAPAPPVPPAAVADPFSDGLAKTMEVKRALILTGATDTEVAAMLLPITAHLTAGKK